MNHVEHFAAQLDVLKEQGNLRQLRPMCSKGG